ncbi:MAG: SUMF1/EgtB/PvdO family nonheme iron enzyme, partial [Kiritimatiellae bacterium]|nr:SUMF1/EgtB/PvdO family nonheme iron enzyme [Kiritimatiellia bacterium]
MTRTIPVIPTITTLLLAAGMQPASFAAPPVVDASSVSLSLDDNGIAFVRYRLTGAPAIVTFDIEHRDPNGDWTSIGVPFDTLTGDANRLVQPDSSAFKEIRWDANRDSADLSFTNGLLRARVTAWDKAAPPDYMVIDLNTFEESFYETADHIPLGGLVNDHYRTNALVMRRIHAAGETFVMGQATSNSEAASCVDSFSPANASQHWVSLTNDFYMAVFETTQAQHRKLGASSSRSKDTSDSRKPVDGISYLRLRMASTGTASDIDWPTTGSAVGGDLAAIRARTGIEFDIPTEAEWEFACRAGTATAYYNGGEFTGPTTGTPSLTNIAWYTKNRDDESITDDGGKLGGLQVVGHKEPNAWGLYDMCGNASEWCKDYAASYDASEQPAIAPTGPVSGTARIKRGGNWYSPGAHAASSSRRSTAHTDYSVDDSSGTGVWANGYRLICPAIGDNGFRISRATGSGKLLSVVMDGEQVLATDPAIETPVEFDADGAEGTWRSHLDWNVHPSESMVQGSLSFEWCGTEPVRLHSITIHHGKMPGGAGGYLLPGMFPPVARQFADFRTDRVEEGSKYTPTAIGEAGGRSVMLAHDELRPYSDYSTPLVTERADGFTLSTRYDSAGWIRPGETQTVGDFWLVFRDGNAEEHLRNTGNWFRKVGMLPPADRPDWVRDIVLYSLHPCGRNDDMRCDPDGLALSRSYLPFLETLGVNCVWMRPIEKESPYMPDDYFSLQSGVGTVEDLTNYVTEAHSRGIRVWRDAGTANEKLIYQNLFNERTVWLESASSRGVILSDTFNADNGQDHWVRRNNASGDGECYITSAGNP